MSKTSARLQYLYQPHAGGNWHVTVEPTSTIAAKESLQPLIADLLNGAWICLGDAVALYAWPLHSQPTKSPTYSNGCAMEASEVQLGGCTGREVLAPLSISNPLRFFYQIYNFRMDIDHHPKPPQNIHSNKPRITLNCHCAYLMGVSKVENNKLLIR